MNIYIHQILLFVTAMDNKIHVLQIEQNFVNWHLHEISIIKQNCRYFPRPTFNEDQIEFCPFKSNRTTDRMEN